MADEQQPERDSEYTHSGEHLLSSKTCCAYHGPNIPACHWCVNCEKWINDWNKDEPCKRR